MNIVKLTIGLLIIPFIISAQISAELIQYPDISDTHIVFTFGDDLWIVDKEGKNASRLISPPGREINPKFSPDGQWLAFQANYDGNSDLYIISVKGGVPNRVTGHGMRESLMDWYPDGKHLLFSSSMESGKQRFDQFYKVNVKGGLPEKLPVELGANAAISNDGKWLAFTDKSRIYRTWKRYRGGTAPDIHLMDLETLKTQNITENDANDELPMFSENTLYYMSDKGKSFRNNIWKYDLESTTHTQLTFFDEFDIHFPSLGPGNIVFEAGGKIHVLDLEDNSIEVIKINAIGDFTRIKPGLKNVSDNIFTYQISPDGQRAVFEARGDIFTLPKKEGVVRNITQTSGVAERHPAWSPDGKTIAFFSDASGEYELHIYDIKSGTEKQLTKLGKGYRYNIFWSPDSKKVAFIDQSMTIYEVEIKDGDTYKIDRDGRLFEGDLRNFTVSYSPDSRYIAYPKSQENNNTAIYIYDNKERKSKKVTSGFYSDNQASFDKEGKYLFLTTNRNLSPIYSDFDNTWIYPNATQLAVITLNNDIKSPLLPKNDDIESGEEDDQEDEEDDDEEDDDEKEEEEDIRVKIDFENMERRMEILPVESGNFGAIKGLKEKLVYLKRPNSGTADGESVLKYYNLKEKKEEKIIEGIRSYEISEKGENILIRKNGDYYIIDFGKDKKAEDKLATGDMVSYIDPRKEWKQIFNDVWRFERDFFYDENMHGIDWDEMKEKYGELINQAMSRYDVNFIIGELIGELNASHTYRGGGDSEEVESKNVGYLGIDWTKKDGEFMIDRIIRGAEWDSEVRSPLDAPGLDVEEGNYILAVNGVRLNTFSDPWIAFTGTADKTVELTVNSKPEMDGSHTILVKPLSSETRLRNLAWIESNRQMVDKLSGGKVGYVYVPSTGRDGQNELIRMFYAQWNKPGLIIDERFNNGGQIPDRFVELLNRQPLAYFDVRDGDNWQWPPIAHFGPKAMLINGWSGSGGDAFPDYFRKSGLGPLIGTRTWGGVIGISGAPSLIDGGGATVPTFRMYDPDGTYFREGHGVEPDIKIKEDHTALAQGDDPQIKKAVEYILEELEKRGPIHPEVPEPEDRSK